MKETNMNKEALCHIPKSNYAYAYKLDELHIRLRTAKDDLEEVTLFYGNKFNWQNKRVGRCKRFIKISIMTTTSIGFN